MGNLLLILTALIWGTAFVGQRMGMDKIEPITFAASRMTLSAIMVGIVALVVKKKNKPIHIEDASKRRKTNIIGGICCGVFLTAGSLLQQIGLVYTSAGKAGFITAMYMLFVPLVSFFIFRKKISLRVWLAVALGIVGMYLLCVKEGFTVTNGDIYILICALMFSGHILCCDHFATKGDPVTVSAIQFATSAVISFILAFITESPSLDKIVSAIVPILYCGILSGGVGYTLQIIAQKHTEPTIASLLMSLESVFAVIAGVIILNETMVLNEIIGCVIMFAAIILVQLPQRRAREHRIQ
ncbi:MAG: DMT family transporter [Clostridiales bacterium]|nr:DMT family transporter [Clostridiales bacterium]